MSLQEVKWHQTWSSWIGCLTFQAWHTECVYNAISPHVTYLDCTLLISTAAASQPVKQGGWPHGASISESPVRVPLILSPARVSSSINVSSLLFFVISFFISSLSLRSRHQHDEAASLWKKICIENNVSTDSVRLVSLDKEFEADRENEKFGRNKSEWINRCQVSLKFRKG